MQSYVHQTMPQDCNQPLDFTSKNNNIMPSILDLSCKKQNDEESNDDVNQSNFGPMSLETGSLTPSREATTTTGDHHPYQSSQITCGNERQSPFEVRTFMITPPSETDSPKKPKFYSMYPQYNLPGGENLSGYSGLPLGPPGFPISPMLANVMTGENLSQFHVPTSLATNILTSQSQNDTSMSVISPNSLKKTPRPFKAYPKNPLAMIMTSPELLEDTSSNEKYNEFRTRMLESVRKTNKTTNIKMRRSKSPMLPTSTDDAKNGAYWERRRKNNEAAKRSRDARRAKEDEIAIRAAFLERENVQLKCEIQALRNELAKLRNLICVK